MVHLMYAVAWKYPSKSRLAVKGFRHHLDSQQYGSEDDALLRLDDLKCDLEDWRSCPERADSFWDYGWFRGTEFYLVGVEPI